MVDMGLCEQELPVILTEFIHIYLKGTEWTAAANRAEQAYLFVSMCWDRAVADT